MIPAVTIIKGLSRKDALLIENACLFWFPFMFGVSILQQGLIDRAPPSTPDEIECDAFGK
jgi:hypothetical protein